MEFSSLIHLLSRLSGHRAFFILFGVTSRYRIASRIFAQVTLWSLL